MESCGTELQGNLGSPYPPPSYHKLYRFNPDGELAGFRIIMEICLGACLGVVSRLG